MLKKITLLTLRYDFVQDMTMSTDFSLDNIFDCDTLYLYDNFVA